MTYEGTPGGAGQRLFAFGNEYGASVICTPYSYGGRQGLFELAVLDATGQITYDTPITDDVIGYLTEDEVQEILGRIAALPSRRGRIIHDVRAE